MSARAPQATFDLERREGPAEALPPGFKRRLFWQLIGEIGPLLAFFLTFGLWGIVPAAGAYGLATAASLGWSWSRHRHLPVLPLISAGLVLLFAGLTIALDNALFIKLKPTVTNGFFALALAASWLAGFRLIRRVLGESVRLDEAGERRLTWRVAAYLAFLALANEIVWRSVGTDLWVLFKVFVMVALNLAFGWSQLALIRRHRVA